MSTPKSLRSIELRVTEIRETLSLYDNLNRGVIRGWIPTEKYTAELLKLMEEYNTRAVRTQYYAGRVVSRKTA